MEGGVAAAQGMKGIFIGRVVRMMPVYQRVIQSYPYPFCPESICKFAH